MGIFGADRPDKATIYVDILDYGRAWNLPSIADGTSNEANSAALGYVLVPWFSTGANSARDFR